MRSCFYAVLFVRYSGFPACLLDQRLSKPFRLADERGVPHVMFDDVVDPVLPAGLRCVDEVLSGSYGAGLVAHAQDVSRGDDTPGGVGSHAPVTSVSHFNLCSEFDQYH